MTACTAEYAANAAARTLLQAHVQSNEQVAVALRHAHGEQGRSLEELRQHVAYIQSTAQALAAEYRELQAKLDACSSQQSIEARFLSRVASSCE